MNPSTHAAKRPPGDADSTREGRPRRNALSNETIVRVEVLIALLCSAVIVLGIAHFRTLLFDASPPPSQPQARGIVWGGRTFVDLAAFARWLRSQGVAYETWALRHPTRAGIAPLRPPAVRQAERAPQPSGAPHRSNWTTPAGVAVVLAALGLLIGIRRRSWVRRARVELSTGRLVVTARGWLRRPRSDLPIEPFVGAARGGTAAATTGARLMRHSAIVAARASSSLATSVGLTLVVVAQGAAAAAAAGGRLMLRSATLAVGASSNGARSGARVAWRRRGQFAWYVGAALFATVSALALTMWA